MPAPSPQPIKPATLAVPVLLSPPWEVLLREGGIANGKGVVPDIDAAEAGKDAGPKARADMDHGTAAGVAVAADGLVVVEGAAGEGGRRPELIADRTPLGDSDLDNVGPRGGAVIAADGLVVAEGTVGDGCGGFKYSADGAAIALVHAGVNIARTAVAAAAADGLGSGRTCCWRWQGRPKKGADGASLGFADEPPDSAVSASGLVPGDGAAGDGNAGLAKDGAARAGPIDGVVSSSGQVAVDRAASDRGTARQDAHAAAKAVPERRRAAEGLVAGDHAAGDVQGAALAVEGPANGPPVEVVGRRCRWPRSGRGRPPDRVRLLPSFKMPPPCSRAYPWVTVRPLMVTFRPAAISKTRLALLPLTVSWLAPGPSMVTLIGDEQFTAGQRDRLTLELG